MAIKEFIIGPQNYWEEGYFNGDYTLPNVAKFYLQCDIDNVKGGRVVTGLYYEDNYIDGTYWHDNTIRAAFSATANKIKDAQVQATGYFVEGYYATGYVEQGIASVLTATASVLIGTSAAISAQASTSTQAGKQVDSQTAMAAVFSQTAIGSRTSDIDLYAFSQGGLTSDVNAIRAYQLDALSSFNIATDYIRQRNTNSDAAAEFTQSIVFERNRDNASATQVAFSFSVSETLFKEYSSNLQSQSSTNTEVSIYRAVDATLSAQSQISCQISHIHGADIQASNFAQLASTPEITRDYQATASSVINLSADANRTRDNDSQSLITAALSAAALKIQPGAADISTAFSSNVVAVKSVEALASQQVSSSVVIDNGRLRESVIPEFSSQIQSNVDGNAVRGVQENFTAQTNVTAIIGTLESITLVVFNFASVIALPFVTAQASSGVSSNLSAGINAVKIVDAGTQIISAFDNINVPGERIRYQDSTVSISTSVVTDNSRTRDNHSQLQSTATVSAVIGKLKDIDLYAFSNNSLITDAVVIRDAVGNIQSAFTSTTNAGKIPPIESAISSSASLSADNIRVRYADSTLTASGGVLSVVDVIPGVQVNMVGNFTTNRPYVDSGYVDDDYATNFETVANYIVDNLHQIVVTSSLTANADYTLDGAALVASAGTLSIDANIIAFTSSSQNVSASVSADVEKLVGFEIAVQSTFTIDANIGTTEDIFGTFFNNVALTADVAKLVDVGSNNSIVSAFYADTENSLTTQGEASVAAAFSSTADINKTASVAADIQALAFTVSIGSAIVVEQANLSATFGFSSDVNVVRSGVASTQFNASTTAQISVTRNAAASISGAMTFVSEVREIRLDEIEYRIPAEGWEYRIVGENREYDIIGETRLRSITGETRVRRIDGETRIYTIE